MNHTHVYKALIRCGFGVLIIVLAFLSFSGCRDGLSEAPPRNGSQHDIEKAVSQVSANVRLEFAQLQALANKEIPQVIRLPDGHGKDVCKKIGPVTDLPFGGKIDLRKKVCAGTKFSEMKITRLGDIRVGPSPVPNMIRITAPLHLNGKIGFRGDGAKLLALDAKRLKTDIEAHIDLGADLDDQWCPKVRTKSGFRFTKGATLEVMHRVNIGVSGQVEKPLREQLSNFAAQIGKKIDCATTKADIENVWAVRSIPIKLTSEEAAYANIEPISMGFTGLAISNDAISFGVVVKALTELATSPMNEVKKPLPKLDRIKPVNTQIDLMVPFRASYDRIADSLTKEMANKEFTAETTVGPLRLTPKEFDVYPSDGRFVIGVRIVADLPTKLFDTKGWVYLYGTPEIIHKGQGLRINKVGFSRQLDNEFWEIATQLLENKINRDIEKASVVDFRKEIQQAQSQLQQQLVKEVSKVKVSLKLENPELGLKKVVFRVDELVALGTFKAGAQLQIAHK